MNYNETVEKINLRLAEDFEIDINTITPQAVMKQVLDLDSLDYIDLVVAIEDTFGFKVQMKDLQSITIFEQLYEYVNSHSVNC